MTNASGRNLPRTTRGRDRSFVQSHLEKVSSACAYIFRRSTGLCLADAVPGMNSPSLKWAPLKKIARCSRFSSLATTPNPAIDAAAGPIREIAVVADRHQGCLSHSSSGAPPVISERALTFRHDVERIVLGNAAARRKAAAFSCPLSAPVHSCERTLPGRLPTSAGHRWGCQTLGSPTP